MKRLFAYLLALALLLGLAGCGTSRREQNRAAAIEAYARLLDCFDARDLFWLQDAPRELRGGYINAEHGETLTLRLNGEPADDLKTKLYEACGTEQITFDWPEFTEEELQAAWEAVKEYNDSHQPPLCCSFEINKGKNALVLMVRRSEVDAAEKLRREHPCILYGVFVTELTPAGYEELKTDERVTLTAEVQTDPKGTPQIVGTLENGADVSYAYCEELVVETFLDGAWYHVPYRPDAAFLCWLLHVGSGDSIQTGEPLYVFDYDFPPGQYRMAVLYTEDFHPLRGRDWDHVAYAEFEIK